MSRLFIGTDGGVFVLDNGKEVVREEGPPAVSFLAVGQEHVYALTGQEENPTQVSSSSTGVLWERAGKGGWRLINRHPVQERVWSFAADPRVAGRLYLGVGPALLYISEDGGESWTARDAIRRIPGYDTWSFPPPPHIPHVRSIASDPEEAGAVYIGVEEGGVYRSADHGETWEGLNEGLYSDVHTITPAPQEGRLYATTGVGFHRSDDSGAHWRHIEEGLDRSYTVPFAVSERPGRVYTAAAASPPPGWGQGANAAIYRSDDSGEHWARLERGLPARFDAMVRHMVVGEGGAIYAAAGSQLFASRDEGESWALVTADLPAIRALAVA